MLSKTSFVIASLFLSACVSMPDKPILEICHISAPSAECLCGLTSTPDVVNRYPIEYCDKATAFRPTENEKRKNYEAALEDELKRVIDKGKSLQESGDSVEFK